MMGWCVAVVDMDVLGDPVVCGAATVDACRSLCPACLDGVVRRLGWVPVRAVVAGLWPSAPMFDTILAAADGRPRRDGLSVEMVRRVRGV